ncbi:hypothetical protein FACS189481_5950 [Clostridia bacterium]|nr:hypothetical protein FACS189481_5950 [Clostridia bacterium]
MFKRRRAMSLVLAMMVGLAMNAHEVCAVVGTLPSVRSMESSANGLESGKTYTISNWDDFIALSNLQAECKIAENSPGMPPSGGAEIRMINDVTAEPTTITVAEGPNSTFLPIGDRASYTDGYGQFRSTFDGGNHTLSGFSITQSTRFDRSYGRNERLGLFASVGQAGVVKNFKMANASIHSGVPGPISAGLLAAQFSGTMFNVAVHGSLDLANVDEFTYAGGLCGQLRGLALGVSADVTLGCAFTVTQDSFIVPSTGGLVGELDGDGCVVGYSRGSVRTMLGQGWMTAIGGLLTVPVVGIPCVGYSTASLSVAAGVSPQPFVFDYGTDTGAFGFSCAPSIKVDDVETVGNDEWKDVLVEASWLKSAAAVGELNAKIPAAYAQIVKFAVSPSAEINDGFPIFVFNEEVLWPPPQPFTLKTFTSPGGSITTDSGPFCSIPVNPDKQKQRTITIKLSKGYELKNVRAGDINIPDSALQRQNDGTITFPYPLPGQGPITHDINMHAKFRYELRPAQSSGAPSA